MKKQFFKIFVLLFFIGNLSFTGNVSNKWKVFGNKEYDIEISKGRRRLNDEISVDDEGVYYLGIKVKNAENLVNIKQEKLKINFKNLELIKPNVKNIVEKKYFLKDGERIFAIYGTLINELKGVDYNTFKLISEDVAIDKDKIYIFGIGEIIVEQGYHGPYFSMKKITGTPPAKDFKFINENLKHNKIFFENNKKLYFLSDGWLNEYRAKELKNIDKKTFKPLEYEFIKDKKSVYYYNSEIDDFVKLEGADTKTFEVIGNGYAKDRNKIYFYDIFRINKYPIKVFADKNSFTIFENMDAEGFFYAEDKDHIYCNGKILEGADYESFKTSRDERYSINKGTVKDKNHEYLKCTIKTF